MKKILLSLTTLTTSAIPIFAVVACSCNPTETDDGGNADNGDTGGGQQQNQLPLVTENDITLNTIADIWKTTNIIQKPDPTNGNYFTDAEFERFKNDFLKYFSYGPELFNLNIYIDASDDRYSVTGVAYYASLEFTENNPLNIVQKPSITVNVDKINFPNWSYIEKRNKIIVKLMHEYSHHFTKREFFTYQFDQNLNIKELSTKYSITLGAPVEHYGVNKELYDEFNEIFNFDNTALSTWKNEYGNDYPSTGVDSLGRPVTINQGRINSRLSLNDFQKYANFRAENENIISDILGDNRLGTDRNYSFWNGIQNTLDDYNRILRSNDGRSSYYQWMYLNDTAYDYKFSFVEQICRRLLTSITPKSFINGFNGEDFMQTFGASSIFEDELFFYEPKEISENGWPFNVDNFENETLVYPTGLYGGKIYADNTGRQTTIANRSKQYYDLMLKMMGYNKELAGTIFGKTVKDIFMYGYSNRENTNLIIKDKNDEIVENIEVYSDKSLFHFYMKKNLFNDIDDNLENPFDTSDYHQPNQNNYPYITKKAINIDELNNKKMYLWADLNNDKNIDDNELELIDTIRNYGSKFGSNGFTNIVILDDNEQSGNNFKNISIDSNGNIRIS